MYACDFVQCKVDCESCLFSQYGDREFSSRESIILELENIIMKANLAKAMLEELSGE